MKAGRTLPWDWHAGFIPDNMEVDPTAYIETTYSFLLFRSKLKLAGRIGHGASTYKGTMFDVGTDAFVSLGDYALIHGARIICDHHISIGNYALISWNVVIMDTYRIPMEIAARRAALERTASDRSRLLDVTEQCAAVRIEPNVWIGFEACILPGVTIGEGSIIGARSVVFGDIPPYTVAVGNPARVIRTLEQGTLTSNGSTTPK